ncbi:MAG: hypothetical protein AB8F95_14745 [Bacteroidia bacterium]
MKKLFIICSMLTIVSSSFAGGPWTQKKGKGYFKLSERWIVFNRHFTDQGKTDPNVTTGIFNTSFYGEIGVSDRFTAILNMPFFSRTYMNNVVSGTTGETIVPGEALNSFGDTDVAVKYALTKAGAKFPVAASLTFGLPLGNPSGGSQGNLQTGDGEFNQMLLLHAGKGGFRIGKHINAYSSIQAGFNNRTNNFSDEIRFGLEGGLGFAKNRFWLIGRIDGVESLKNGATAASVTSTSIFANNTEFTGVSLEAAYYATKRFGISASASGAFRGEIIAAAPAFSFGIFLDTSR